MNFSSQSVQNYSMQMMFNGKAIAELSDSCFTQIKYVQSVL